jgi:DNA-binding MarR family transcriptional regulator
MHGNVNAGRHMPADTPKRTAIGAALPETPCTCAALRRTARRLTQAYDRALRPAGLRLTQYSVLANLARAVAEGRALTVTDLARRLAMDRTTLTRNLRPLEAAGWILITAGPDRRSRTVVLTKAGMRSFEAAQPLWQAAERTFRQALGREDAAELRRLLDAAMGSVG